MGAVVPENLLQKTVILIGKIKEDTYQEGRSYRSALFADGQYANSKLDDIPDTDRIWVKFYTDKETDVEALKTLKKGQSRMLMKQSRKGDDGMITWYVLLPLTEPIDSPPPSNGSTQQSQSKPASSTQSFKSLSREEKREKMTAFTQSMAELLHTIHGQVFNTFEAELESEIVTREDIRAMTNSIYISTARRFGLENQVP